MFGKVEKWKEGRKCVEGSLDRNQLMRLFGKKERKKDRKSGGKNMHVGPTIFYPSNIDIGGKTLFSP